MAFRCRHCGYVFKKTDSDLCPECFTAREDVDCMDFDRYHSHEKESYSSGYDHPDRRPSSREKPVNIAPPQYRSRTMNDLYGMFSGNTDQRNVGFQPYDQNRHNDPDRDNYAAQKLTKLFIIVFLLFFLIPILSSLIGLFATFFDILNM